MFNAWVRRTEMYLSIAKFDENNKNNSKFEKVFSPSKKIPNHLLKKGSRFRT
jgi:hypothetical protein